MVVRNSAGDKTLILSGYSYSKLPTALLAIPDGQTVTVPGAAIEAGDEVLWLFYETGTETIGFIVAATDLPTPKLSISDASVTEGNATATAGTDYEAASGTLTFNPGETSKTIAITVSGDTDPESNEDFVVNLSSAVNARPLDWQGLGVIVNDDDGLPPG